MTNLRALVTVFGIDEEAPLDFPRMTYGRALREKRDIVTCAWCDEPAVLLDSHWPYYSANNRCEKHRKERMV